MSNFPKDSKKIQATIKRYENALRKEQKQFGAIMDGAGKRYLLGPLYLLKGDKKGALRSFTWFEKTFPDDIGDPEQYLCWTLALYQNGNYDAATLKLRQTMLMNLYLIPYVLGIEQAEYEMWHSSNLEYPDYVKFVSSEIIQLWKPDELTWMNETYHSQELTNIRTRYIEIYTQLKDERPGPTRTALVREAYALREAT